jgi:hypothetical protein
MSKKIMQRRSATEKERGVKGGKYCANGKEKDENELGM